MSKLNELFEQKLHVVNFGIESFYDDLVSQRQALFAAGLCGQNAASLFLIGLIPRHHPAHRVARQAALKGPLRPGEAVFRCSIRLLSGYLGPGVPAMQPEAHHEIQ